MRLFRNRRVDPNHLDSASWVLWRWVDIMKGHDPYLTRLIIFRCPWFQVFLHWIHKPDEDDAVHDHPWSFLSILLRGSYIEDAGIPSRNQKWLSHFRRRRVRFFNFKNSKDAHQIIETHGAVSLIITGPKTKSWGFYTLDPAGEPCGDLIPVNYTPWRDFLKAKA